DAWVYMGSLSTNATRFAAKYSSRIQHDAEMWRNRSALRQKPATSVHSRPYVFPSASRKNQRRDRPGSSASHLLVGVKGAAPGTAIEESRYARLTAPLGYAPGQIGIEMRLHASLMVSGPIRGSPRSSTSLARSRLEYGGLSIEP